MSFDYPGSGFVAAVAATGTITCAANTAAADGDTVTIGDNFTAAKVYEYDKSSNGVTATRVSWAVGTTAASNATALAALIVANQPAFTVVDNLAGVLTLTQKWPGLGGNVTIASSGGVISAKTGMAGGLSAVATSITADTTIKLHKDKGRGLRIERVHLNVPVGLAASASDWCNFKLLKGASTIMANFSTLNTAQGTITADTPVEMVLSATVANRFLADGDQLSLFLDITGSPTVPPGRIVVEGYEL